MMKRLGLALLLCAGLLKAESYLVGVENIEYFPQYSHENGEYRGYAREILDAFAKDAGHTFTYEPLPVKRLFGLFIKGSYDFKYPDNPYWSQDLKKGVNVSYSDPVVQYIDGVMVLAERKGKGVESLKKLGMVMGFTAFEYLEQINAGKIEVSENKNFTALLKQAMMGRVDGAYANVAVAQYQMREVLKEGAKLEFDASLPHTKDAYRLSTIKHPKLVEEFNAWMKEKPELIKTLKEKYQVEAGVQ